jgi:phage FluMu protein Com
MADKAKAKEDVIQVVCPHCRTVLWIDSKTEEVIKTEKAGKEKKSLDDLLLKEKKRQEEFGRKFELTAELEKKKHEKAEELFRKGLSKTDKDD